MTDNEARALGERWTEAGGGWGYRVAEGGDSFPRSLVTDGGMFVPDLRTPAAFGIALAVVRDRWGAPRLYLFPGNNGWNAYIIPDGRVYEHDDADPVNNSAEGFETEAEALVAALEAAPKR